MVDREKKWTCGGRGLICGKAEIGGRRLIEECMWRVMRLGLYILLSLHLVPPLFKENFPLSDHYKNPKHQIAQENNFSPPRVAGTFDPMNTSANFNMNPLPFNEDLPFQPSLYEEDIQLLSSAFQPQGTDSQQWAQPIFDAQGNIIYGSGFSGAQGLQPFCQQPSSSFNASGSQGDVWASSFDSDPTNGVIDWHAFWESYWGEGVNIRRNSPQTPLVYPGYNSSLQTGSSSSFHQPALAPPESQSSQLQILPMTGLPGANTRGGEELEKINMPGKFYSGLEIQRDEMNKYLKGAA